MTACPPDGAILTSSVSADVILFSVIFTLVLSDGSSAYILAEYVTPSLRKFTQSPGPADAARSPLRALAVAARAVCLEFRGIGKSN